MPLTLGICELYHPKIHGNTSSSNKHINSHYIVNCILELDDFISNSYELELDHLTRMYNNINMHYRNKYISHPVIENYDAIIRRRDYIRLEIIETRILEGMEEIAILKTYWLRLVQRKWKRLYKNKMELVKKKMSWQYLKKREIFGR